VGVLIQTGRLDLVRGDLGAAFENLEQARLRIESEGAPDTWMLEVQEAMAELELWEGRPRAAYDVAQEALRLLAAPDENQFGAPLLALGLRALADERETEAGRPRRGLGTGSLAERHRELADIAARFAQNPLEVEAGTLSESGSYAALCRAELGRLEGSGRPQAWTTAADRWAALERPFHHAYAKWREAEALFAAGGGEHAIAALRTAHETATGLGARRLVEELVALARWYRVPLHEGAGPAVPEGQADGLEQLGLTPRELEVLHGLVAGRSNREIADELFISVKTASVHVSNILRKLDVSGRQEAARIAHRLGLSRRV
jgi:DNA-binding CsgD family transcriptional regulator